MSPASNNAVPADRCTGTTQVNNRCRSRAESCARRRLVCGCASGTTTPRLRAETSRLVISFSLPAECPSNGTEKPAADRDGYAAGRTGYRAVGFVPSDHEPLRVDQRLFVNPKKSGAVEPCLEV